MPTWIDDEGRLRERVDDRRQFLMHVPLELLDPWISYDSWRAELAIKLITIGYDLDINAYWDEAKDWPHGSTGLDSAFAYVDVYQRGMSIAQSSVEAGLLKNPDTPAKWLAWAKRKGYDVAHLEPRQTEPATVNATPAPVMESDSANLESELPHWKMQVQSAAADHWKNLRAGGANPTVSSILAWVAKWCIDNDVRTDGGVNPSAGYLRTHVLSGKHWTTPR